MINFEIDASGRVAAASQGLQDDQINEPSVVDCVVGVIEKLEFSASARGKETRALHRFEFYPR